MVVGLLVVGAIGSLFEKQPAGSQGAAPAEAEPTATGAATTPPAVTPAQTIDAQADTTVLSSAPAPTAAPTQNMPCPDLLEHRDGLICGPSVYGPLWIDAPFSDSDDRAALLPALPQSTDLSLQVGDFGFLAVGPVPMSSLGHDYLCVNVGLKNFGSSIRLYTVFDFRLLTPHGELETISPPAVADQSDLLSNGELASTGYVTGYVCFDDPGELTGRFALVYTPLALFDNTRALFYFDR